MASADPVAVRAVARGRVQGVGFRWFVRNAADSLGVAGWARNLPDGSVEIVASAGAGPMEQFLAIVGRGPPGAHVSKFDVADIPQETVDSKSFHIKH